MRGHDTISDSDEEGNIIDIYLDTRKEVKDSHERPCIKCGKYPTREGYDACLGELPGVEFACCGHGKEGYIRFNNGIIIRGFFKVEKREDKSEYIKEFINKLKRKKMNK
ncbi:MAG: hypothetical protein ACPK7O_06240 [Methanobacterium sp.]